MLQSKAMTVKIGSTITLNFKLYVYLSHKTEKGLVICMGTKISRIK
jgi:hypothetical protein